jgi:hypothetical protein
MEAVPVEPWYTQFWPWFIMALPATAVVAGLTTWYLAVSSAPAMVVDDYGRIAMVTAARAERSKRAEQLGLSAQLSFNVTTADESSPLSVSLEQLAANNDWPDSLLLQLVHPTLSARDLTVEMTGQDGEYTAVLQRPVGRYYVSLSDKASTWRLTGELLADATGLELFAGSRAAE